VGGGERVVVGAVLALTGCSLSISSKPTASSSPPSSAVSSTAAEPSPALDELPASSAAVPTWTEADAETTRLLALQAMGAYAADVPADVWYEQLAGLLTPAGQAAYYGTDPAEVAVTNFADATVTSPSAWLAEATVDTDAGPYLVLMVREDGISPWRVERIRPVQ